MLSVENISTYYGTSQALFSVSLQVKSDEVVTLLGRNGMGKSTTVKSIMGLKKTAAGRIAFNSAPIHRLPSYEIARQGIGLVPEGRQIFPTLTVRENLVATAANRSNLNDSWTLDKVFIS